MWLEEPHVGDKPFKLRDPHVWYHLKTSTQLGKNSVPVASKNYHFLHALHLFSVSSDALVK